MKTHLKRTVNAIATLIAIGWSTIGLPATALAQDAIPTSPPASANAKANAKADASAVDAAAAATTQPVDVNTASLDELVVLPRIGPAVAARVIAYREQNGGFRSVDELMNVRGIGTKTFEQLRTHVTVGDDAVRKDAAGDTAGSSPTESRPTTPEHASNPTESK